MEPANPAFMLKIKDDSGYQIAGVFRLTTPGNEIFIFEARGFFINDDCVNRIETFCFDEQVHEFMLSFEDGRKEEGEYLISNLSKDSYTNGDQFYNIRLQRVMTLHANNKGVVEFIDPLREAVETHLPTIAEAIEEYDQLLACGDCGNRYGPETESEMQALRDRIAAIRNAMQIKPQFQQETLP